MAKIWLAPFDPSMEFVVRRQLQTGGREWRNGDAFDKACVSERTLRQLYEGRAIAAVELAQTTPEPELAPEETETPPAGETAPVEAPAPTKAELQEQARALGIRVHSQWGVRRLQEEIAKASDGAA